MADNVAIKDFNNASATIASDEVGGAQYQIIKLALGADGVATLVALGQALMAASVPVTLASNQSAVPVSGTFWQATQPVSGTVTATIGASENMLGLVGSSDIVVTVTPTVDTNIYAAGDLLFDSAAIANAVRANGYCAILDSVTIIDKADQKAAFTLILANAETDFGAANGAPNPDDTECATVIGWVPVVAADYFDLGAASVACIRNIGLLCKAGAATTSLYVAGVNGTGTPTFGAASDLVLQLGFVRS